MGQCSTEGSTVADLGVADLRGGCGQQTDLAADQVAGLHIAVPGEGADGQHVTVLAHIGEVGQSTDVDHDRRGRQPVLHERQQGVPTCQELGLVAVLGEEGEGVLGRGGQLVFECDRDHRAPPAACRTAATMLWYPVQRQRFPSSPSRTSASVGSGTSSRSETAAMTIPGVQ